MNMFARLPVVLFIMHDDDCEQLLLLIIELGIVTTIAASIHN